MQSLAPEQGVHTGARDRTRASVHANREALETIGRTLSLDDNTIHACLEPRSSVERHAGPGAAAPNEVRRMAGQRQTWLDRDRKNVRVRDQKVRKGVTLLAEAVAEITAA